MYKSLLVIITIWILASCGSSGNFGSSPEEKDLKSLIRKIDKKNSDPELVDQAVNLYQSISARHLNNIAIYKTLTEPSRYVKILNEYRALQLLNNVVIGSAEMRYRLDIPDYTAKMETVKAQAAAEYYDEGMKHFQKKSRNGYLHAYESFTWANQMVPGYKDVQQKIKFAYNLSRLNIVINPVTDETHYYDDSEASDYADSYNDKTVQSALVSDLGGNYNSHSIARYYTDQEAASSGIPADWYIDIVWTRLDMPAPQTYRYSRSIEKQVETGTDTSGHPIYATVKATLDITRRYFTAYGELESQITEAATSHTISHNTFQPKVEWKQEYATYTGDRSALSASDWDLVNNSTPTPHKEDILKELYENTYIQLKNGIAGAVKREQQSAGFNEVDSQQENVTWVEE